MNKLPPVYMILMQNNPVSMYYRGRVESSWIDAGFDLNFVEAVTPRTMNKEPLLKFYLKSKGKRKRPFTETEKAVWHSHRKCWKMVSEKDTPMIIIEHDVLLLEPINSDIFSDCPIMGLCHVSKRSNPRDFSAGGAYYITPNVAKEMYEDTSSISVRENSDRYIHRKIDEHNGDWNIHYSTQIYNPDVGKTIEHGNENVKIDLSS